MTIRRLKDESKLVAKWKLKAGKKHYYHVFLWKTEKDFYKNTEDTETHGSCACVNFSPTIVEMYKDKNTNTTEPKKKVAYKEKTIIRPKLGEIHFIKDKWNLEIVAHELCHAIMHRIRQLNDNGQEIMEQEEEKEEEICYEFGAWMEVLYRELWEINPPFEYKKTNQRKKGEK